LAENGQRNRKPVIYNTIYMTPFGSTLVEGRAHVENYIFSFINAVFVENPYASGKNAQLILKVSRIEFC